MGRVEFEHVGKRFHEVTALADFTLTVESGELITVLGPSGCGKSTLLRVTAGLEALSHGSIHLDARRIDGLPPNRRDVAMVFQSYALYPHMSVRGNIEFPLRMGGTPRAERRRLAEEVAELLELSSLIERQPAQLSGGQRQRVALARALVRRPALFLLDEPLSNVDGRLRLSLRQYIRDLQRRLRVTTVYVTHDQTEAMTLGERMVVMHQGRIQQVDTPSAVYDRPANMFVASFVGSPPMNLIPAEYAGGVLRVADQRLPLPDALCRNLGASARALMVGIRPEAFGPARDQSEPALTAVTDSVSIEILGSETLVRASVGPHSLTARLPGSVRAIPAQLEAPFHQWHLFAATSGERIGPQAVDTERS